MGVGYGTGPAASACSHTCDGRAPASEASGAQVVDPGPDVLRSGARGGAPALTPGSGSRPTGEGGSAAHARVRERPGAPVLCRRIGGSGAGGSGRGVGDPTAGGCGRLPLPRRPHPRGRGTGGPGIPSRPSRRASPHRRVDPAQGRAPCRAGRTAHAPRVPVNSGRLRVKPSLRGAAGGDDGRYGHASRTAPAALRSAG